MREKIIEILEGNDFVSGEHIAEQLGVSRTAVWKHIKNLQKIGYNIDCVKNRGYRLVSKPDAPIPSEIYKGLNTKIIGKKIIFLDSVDSTNNYCKKLVEKNVDEGVVVVSDIQIGGRGRKKRFWDSPSGGLWFSVVLYPNIMPYNGMIITMAVSVSLVQAIKDVVGLECTIKWPNDLIIDGKKVCGVLTELDAEIDCINHAIVGVGLNVNNYVKKELRSIAISLKDVNNDVNVSRVDLLRSILQHIDENYSYVKNGNYRVIRDLWKSYSNIVNKKICVKKENETITGFVSDIDDAGCIILDAGDNLEKIVTGDVTIL